MKVFPWYSTEGVSTKSLGLELINVPIDSTSKVLWLAGEEKPAFQSAGISLAVSRVRETAFLIRIKGAGSLGVGFGGGIAQDRSTNSEYVLAGVLPPLFPEWLGDPAFMRIHQVRFPYVVGEMATGIATASMVIAVAKAGFLSFFGAAGLAPEIIENAVNEIQRGLARTTITWGSNLIHSPQIGGTEESTVDIYLRRGVTKMSASAFMALTPSVVRYSATGLRELPSGQIERRNSVFAKVSRVEVAAQFMSPAPVAILEKLVSDGLILAAEARLAARVPVAEDITVEADSGGHTDNRPLTALVPAVIAERDRIVAKYRFERAIRIGAAGGLGTPQAVAAAFTLGAAYVMTGSINQSAMEAGTSPGVKKLLAVADVADCAMASAGDMFEMGVKVQVLKRGTLFAVRANKLYQTWQEYSGLTAIPATLAAQLEKDVFRASFSEVWEGCREYWEIMDPTQIQKAERDSKHKMALVFRWYLGSSSKWARDGKPGRELDYQIWCGPAMGAFNQWVADSFLAQPSQRSVVQIGRNLMEGAAVVTRAQQMRAFGVPVPPAAFHFKPRPLN